MTSVTSVKLAELQKSAEFLRHICILAHVDHGKTTLADSLLASNGIIPQKMVGKMRYMDTRKDEQERGITMKSSSVAIHYRYGDDSYLINLIDSPGHADFSAEVSTAVRLCDGAVILVDVVEGVCTQTKVAIRQAWNGKLHPLLVLNKIDRLILDWKLTPADAYFHLVQILEQVNAVVGELFATDIVNKSDGVSQQKQESEEAFDWSSGLYESDDSSVYFSPEQGNVVFACALDGWGFSLSHFAKIYSEKLGFSEDVLKKTLWSDFYLNTKNKRIMKGAQAKGKKTLFVQFILENIWAVYNAILINQEKTVIDKIVQSLKVKISARDTKQYNTRSYLQAVMSQWLPLSNAVLEMVCRFVPSPANLSEEKIESFMCSGTHKFDNLPHQTRLLKKDFQACSSVEDAPVIVYISKMFPVARQALSRAKVRKSVVQCKSVTAEEILLRRERARQILATKLESKEESKPSVVKEAVEDENDSTCSNLQSNESDVGTAFIAFARIFSGTLKKGQKVYVLGPKHDPAEALKSVYAIDEKLTLEDLRSDQHVTVATVGDVYLLMGEDVEALDGIPAGNVLGIGGLEDHVLKSATLSDTIACPRFIDLQSTTVPIMRVALEPVCPREMPALVHGMKLLNQADPCVQVLIQESGEHVLVTAGEVHLQRCVSDLKERFANIEINVSDPIVPFRETVLPPPKIDMVNEIVIEKLHHQKKTDTDNCNDGRISVKTANKMSSICITAVPLPPKVTKCLEENAILLKEQDQALCSLYSGEKDLGLASETLMSIEKLKTELSKLFVESGDEWTNAVDQIWSFGPRRCGPNILLNRVVGYDRPSVWITNSKIKDVKSPLFNYDSSFISGFQLASLAGPLCDEPMMGVCFVVSDWTIEKDTVQEQHIADGEQKSHSSAVLEVDTKSICSSDRDSVSSAPFGPFTGQIMSTVKEACKKAFQAQPQRLMAAMYSCSIQVPSDVLGKTYGVLSRRHGRVLHADLQEGSQTFFVTAELPVVESFDFSNEMRKQTSGAALPQLVFSHWEVVDVDPFWVPSTDEEYAHFGEIADVENRALKYVNSVRRRKGLSVDEKIVEHGEKQRTLMKKK